MNDPKQLKVVLLIVVVVSAVMLGYSTYRQKQLERAVANFNYGINVAKTSEEAQLAYDQFLLETNTGLQAGSAAAQVNLHSPVGVSAPTVPSPQVSSPNFFQQIWNGVRTLFGFSGNSNQQNINSGSFNPMGSAPEYGKDGLNSGGAGGLDMRSDNNSNNINYWNGASDVNCDPYEQYYCQP